MCHEARSHPPRAPIAGGAGVTNRRLTLAAADGNRVLAFSALSDRADAPGIVVMPDVRGLHPFYQELAQRFAEAGVHATAIDYFGRTAEGESRGDDFDFMSHVRQTTPEGITADVGAAVTYLRSPEGGTATNVFTVGFCFGGRNSFNQAAEDHGLAGVIGFYGQLLEFFEGDPNTPVRRVGSYRCPVLGLFGGADSGIPPEARQEFRHALDGAGVLHDVVVYDGAPHSFFDRAFDQYREQCDDAWRRVLTFIESTG